jgi:divalent metal cation (Fe/Co/Zn/Cd) transporter
LSTRQAAASRFVSVHVLVPGELTVHDAHHIAAKLENEINKELGEAVVITHIEPVEDKISLEDISLDRKGTL